MSDVVRWDGLMLCDQHVEQARLVSDFAVCFPWQADDCLGRLCSWMASLQFRVAARRRAIDRGAAQHWGRQMAVSLGALFGDHLFGAVLPGAVLFGGDPPLRDLSGDREVVPSAASAEVVVGPWRLRCRSSA